MNIIAPAGAKRITLEATIIRADGRVEKLGEVAHWDKSPLRRFWWRLKHFFRR